MAAAGPESEGKVNTRKVVVRTVQVVAILLVGMFVGSAFGVDGGQKQTVSTGVRASAPLPATKVVQVPGPTVEVPGPTVEVPVVPQACRDLVAVGNDIAGLAATEGQAAFNDLNAYLSTLPATATYGDVYPQVRAAYDRYNGLVGQINALYGRWQTAAGGCR